MFFLRFIFTQKCKSILNIVLVKCFNVLIDHTFLLLFQYQYYKGFLLLLFPGKAKKVDKSAVEHTVKKKRRRANRINLIAEDIDDVTALDEIEGVDLDRADKVDKLDVFSAEDGLEVPVGDLLCSTPSPGPVATQELLDLDLSTHTEQRLSEDLKEFDVVQGEEVALTSNLAILSLIHI